MEFAIIAAGEGSRLRQEGITTPKPLIRIGGERLIDRLIRIFLARQATAISIIINEEMREVKEHLSSLNLPVPLHVVVQSTPSSMHSFYHLSSHINGDKFCLTTVDTIFDEEEFAAYIRDFAADNRFDGYMGVTSYIDDESPLYIDTTAAGIITAFSDTAIEGSPFISGGIYGLTRPAIAPLRRLVEAGSCRMRNYQRELLNEGLALRAYPFRCIIDVDHAYDIATAEGIISREL